MVDGREGGGRRDKKEGRREGWRRSRWDRTGECVTEDGRRGGGEEKGGRGGGCAETPRQPPTPTLQWAWTNNEKKLRAQKKRPRLRRRRHPYCTLPHRPTDAYYPGAAKPRLSAAQGSLAKREPSRLQRRRARRGAAQAASPPTPVTTLLTALCCCCYSPQTQTTARAFPLAPPCYVPPRPLSSPAAAKKYQHSQSSHSHGVHARSRP